MVITLVSMVRLSPNADKGMHSKATQSRSESWRAGLDGISGTFGASRPPCVADAHHDADRFRGRESDALATPLGRLGFRESVQARSAR